MLSQFKHRRGIAPLELMMVLPIILLLFVCVIFTAVSMMTTCETDVLCRNKTWKTRIGSDDATKPFRFSESANPASTTTLLQKIYSGTGMDKLGYSAQSDHLIYCGAWDYHRVDLDHSSFFRRSPVAVLCASSGANEILSLGNSMTFDGFQSLFNSAFGQFKSMYGIAEIESAMEEAKQIIEDVKEKAKKESQKLIDTNIKDIATTERNIASLKKSLENELRTTPGMQSIQLNDITSLPGFHVAQKEDFFKESLERMKNLSEEEKKMPQNAQDHFIEKNIESLKQLRIEQDKNELLNKALDNRKNAHALMN